jgi:Ca2+-binding RTX toxin-like protein
MQAVRKLREEGGGDDRSLEGLGFLSEASRQGAPDLVHVDEVGSQTFGGMNPGVGPEAIVAEGEASDLYSGPIQFDPTWIVPSAPIAPDVDWSGDQFNPEIWPGRTRPAPPFEPSPKVQEPESQTPDLPPTPEDIPDPPVQVPLLPPSAIPAAGPDALVEVLGTGEGDILELMDGEDALYGLGGNDFLLLITGEGLLSGGEGDDGLIMIAASGRMDGGAGDDRISLRFSGDATLNGGEGDDVLSVTWQEGALSALLNGGDGADTFRLGAGGDITIADYNFAEGDILDLVGDPGNWTKIQDGADLLLMQGTDVIRLLQCDYAAGLVIV